MPHQSMCPCTHLPHLKERYLNFTCTHAHVYTCTHVHACTLVHAPVRTNACVHVCMHVCACVHTCVHACVHACLCFSAASFTIAAAAESSWRRQQGRSRVGTGNTQPSVFNSGMASPTPGSSHRLRKQKMWQQPNGLATSWTTSTQSTIRCAGGLGTPML